MQKPSSNDIDGQWPFQSQCCIFSLKIWCSGSYNVGKVARRCSSLHQIFSSMIGFCESATETIIFVIEGKNVNNIIAKKLPFLINQACYAHLRLATD